MPRTRCRPTFLLQVAVLLLTVLLSAGACALALAIGGGKLFLAALGLGALLFLLSGDFATLLVWFMTRRAEKTEQHSSSWWVVESEETKQRDAAQFHESTKDNPTLR